METIEGEHAPIKAWIHGVDLEDQARAQLRKIAKLPFIYKHVAVMPDVHWGLGATIGSVIATKGAVIPAAVGVDLGCGMLAVRTSLKANALPDNLRAVRTAIEQHVPHGRTDHGGRNDRGSWSDVPTRVTDVLPVEAITELIARNPKVAGASGVDGILARAHRQLGTLGSGNHFIELCLDERNAVWIMLHSGSRGLGNILASYYIEEAKKQAALFGYEADLPDKDLAWLSEETPVFAEYVGAVELAQEYARRNRIVMLEQVRAALEHVGLEHHLNDAVVNCHHNYLAREEHFGETVLVTRKGAVRARRGDYGIIPGSMGAKSYIVRGKGNPDSFDSCSHGAGRKMGRQQAKRTISLADFNAAMGDVESRRDKDVVDEAPQAYKDIEAVMAAQADLVEVVHTLKQVLVVKG